MTPDTSITEETSMPRTNGMPQSYSTEASGTRPRVDIDPTVSLVIQAQVRAMEALSDRLVSTVRENTSAVKAMAVELRAHREQNARTNLAFASGGLIVTLVLAFGILATRGVDPERVASATVMVSTPAPAAPVEPTVAPVAPTPISAGPDAP